MKERPILFSGPMVRAILEGRKTQTRRVVSQKGISNSDIVGVQEYRFIEDAEAKANDMDSGFYAILKCNANQDNGAVYFKCPYGQPGDRLWVRETWKVGAWRDDGRMAIDYKASPEVTRTPWCYPDNFILGSFNKLSEESWDECCDADTPENPLVHWEDGRGFVWEAGKSPCRWRPSIFMPRWASRITMEIISVRVERLQDISEADVLSEGTTFPVTPDGHPLLRLTGKCPPCDYLDKGDFKGIDFIGNEYRWMKAHYASLWDSINGKSHPWDSNPWVWVVEFKSVTP